MLRRAALVAAIVGIATPRLHAQDVSEQCTSLLTQDACQKSLDLFAYMAPQLGTVIAGGSPVLGQTAVLTFLGSGRAFPSLSVGLRVNVLQASLPVFERVNFSLTGASNATAIPVRERLVPGPALDAAIGVLRGIPFRGSYALSVDALVSALYLPRIDEFDVSVRTPNGGLKLGWGARLGLFQETSVTPGIALSYLRRELPRVEIEATPDEIGDDVMLHISNLRKRTESWRLVLSKRLTALQIAIGGGQDVYDASAQISVTVNGVAGGPFRAEQNVTRTNLFTDLIMSVGPFRLSGEIGRVSGGDIQTFNRFQGSSPDAARFYGSLGVRLTL